VAPLVVLAPASGRSRHSGWSASAGVAKGLPIKVR